MLRTTKLISISLAPELLKEAEDAAKQEHRTRSEFFRAALRNYLEEKRWQNLNHYGQMKADEQGLTEKDVDRLIHEYRKSNDIARV